MLLCLMREQLQTTASSRIEKVSPLRRNLFLFAKTIQQQQRALLLNGLPRRRIFNRPNRQVSPNQGVRECGMASIPSDSSRPAGAPNSVRAMRTDEKDHRGIAFQLCRTIARAMALPELPSAMGSGSQEGRVNPHSA